MLALLPLETVRPCQGGRYERREEEGVEEEGEQELQMVGGERP